MKKRILALLLAVITVFYVCPVYSIPATAEAAPSTQTETDMTVGKHYSAFLKKTNETESIYLYNDANGTLAYETAVRRESLPEILTVVLEGASDKCVKTANLDWPEHLDEYRYIDLNDIVVTECIETDDGYITGKVLILGETVANNKVTITNGEKIHVTADPDDDIESDAKYQWQVKIGENKWAVISGYIFAFAPLSRSLLINVTKNGVAYMRCIVTSNGTKYVSPELAVTLTEVSTQTAASTEMAVPQTIETENTALQTKLRSVMRTSSDIEPFSESAFQIVISYTFRHKNPSSLIGKLDTTPAANTFTVTLPSGGQYSGTVTSPSEVGYQPYVKVSQKDYVTEGTSSDTVIEYDGEYYVAANSIEFKNVSQPVHVEVFYIPQKVSFTIKIYEQRLYDDEYSLAATEVYEDGIANAAVGANLAKPRNGFKHIDYETNLPVNEDGTTVVEIYYDRNYYLIDFDTVDNDANGATPHLIRYNTPLMLPRPSLKGYTFKNWTLVSVKDTSETTVNVHSYQTSVTAGTTVNVQHNLLYRAEWDLATSFYTIVYWIEDADSRDSQNKKNYNVWYTYKIATTTGQNTLAGGDHIKKYVVVNDQFTQNNVNDVSATYPYLIYMEGLTDTEPKVTKGNGTTVINVYYARKEYQLKFYYAIEKTANSKTTYHIIGGSTYYFGSYASGNARTNEVEAMRQYASGSMTGQTGQITALPTLNSKGQTRNYTLSSDTDGDGSYKYHYLSFKAKFGADITNLWPCDVFNSAERTSSNTHGNWSGKQAFVSAWNGEYNVRYTQDTSVNNGNQTIKGNYTVLDANLLWNSTSNTETTIAYACFWENGANINWSVPELYRYNIYLPLLPGQDTTGLTLKTHTDGVTYYLSTQYNTCDDSTVGAQTQPGLVGFKSNGRTWQTITSFDTSLYKEAYDMFFFYSRNIHHLTFNDMHGNTVSLTVPYDTYIGGHSEEDHAPEYPEDFEQGECKFVGWYFDETCTIYFDHNQRMPAKNIQLYAKWETISYNIKVYFDTNKTILAHEETVPFGSFVNEPMHKAWQESQKDYKKLIFIGWYYKDGSEEVRFDFNTMMIKNDMEIYAKWTSEVLVPYTIYYVTLENGEYVEIAPRISLDAMVGITKFFVAKVGSNLNPGYQSGYFPEMRSHSMTMKATGVNEYYFVYTHTTDLFYTVTHTFVNESFVSILGTNTFTKTFEHSISGEEIVKSAASVHISFREGITKDIITQAAEEAANKKGKTLDQTQKNSIWTLVTQMSPDYYIQELVLTTSQQNATEFKWENRGQSASYQIIHLYENLNGEYVPDFNKIENNVADFNTTITAIARQDDAYELNTSHPSYKQSGQVTGLSVNSDGTLSTGLVLRMYYSLKRYEYTVSFYKIDTSIALADPIVGRTAPHGTTINIADVYKNIDGYVIENIDESVVIASDNMNVICKYQGLQVLYRYQITGSDGATLDVHTDNETVVGARPKSSTLTLLNNGYFLNKWYYVVGNGEKQPVPQEWISNNGMTVSPTEAPVEWAGKAVTIYAEVLPTTRRFKIQGASEDITQAFIFNIKSVQKGSEIDVTFVIFGNDYVDVERLPYGEYTVTVGGWAWRYGTPTLTFNGQLYTAVDGKFSLMLTDSGDVTFNYSKAPNDKWLTDELSGYLKFTDGQS